MNTVPVDRFRADRVGPPQLPLPSQPSQVASPGIPSFAEHLKRACEEIGCRTQFSAHAQARVESRGIALDTRQLQRIDRALDSAAAKGVQRALVMLDDLALVVGVEKRRVITLVDAPALRGNIFTSIDAAVIA